MESGAGIIPALRETAAWLLALQPADTAWAEDADLTVLAVHGALIDAPAMRAALVERILASPRTFTGLGWRRGWNLTHPGLGGQLTPVLAALADPDMPQPDPDQAYLALMLARQASPADVITPVLQAAARPDLDYGLRAVAARTAATLDEAAAVPVLAGVLAEIGEHPDRDPDDELRGIALSVLWPGHLAADVLAASLTTPQRDNMLGAYYMFRRRLPGQLSDDDVPHLLNRALTCGAGPAGSGRGPGRGRLAVTGRRRPGGRTAGPGLRLPGRRCCHRPGRRPGGPLPARRPEPAPPGGARRPRCRRGPDRRSRGGCAGSWPPACSATRTTCLAVHQLIWGWQPSRAAQERDAEARSAAAGAPPWRHGWACSGPRTCAGRWRRR